MGNKKLIALSFLSAVLLAGCGEDMTYKGKLMSKSEVQERMADELEAENPNLDIEIEIKDYKD